MITDDEKIQMLKEWLIELQNKKPKKEKKLTEEQIKQNFIQLLR